VTCVSKVFIVKTHSPAYCENFNHCVNRALKWWKFCLCKMKLCITIKLRKCNNGNEEKACNLNRRASFYFEHLLRRLTFGIMGLFATLSLPMLPSCRVSRFIYCNTECHYVDGHGAFYWNFYLSALLLKSAFKNNSALKWTTCRV